MFLHNPHDTVGYVWRAVPNRIKKHHRHPRHAHHWSSARTCGSPLPRGFRGTARERAVWSLGPRLCRVIAVLRSLVRGPREFCRPRLLSPSARIRRSRVRRSPSALGVRAARPRPCPAASGCGLLGPGSHVVVLLARPGLSFVLGRKGRPGPGLPVVGRGSAWPPRSGRGRRTRTPPLRGLGGGSRRRPREATRSRPNSGPHAGSQRIAPSRPGARRAAGLGPVRAVR